MDRLTKQHRSWNMSRIRGANTKPEIRVRSMLHRMGYRFRLHRKDLPGKPDIVLPKYETVIFVHGCFWHRHEGCRYTTSPSTRQEFWQAKFTANVVRDEALRDKLLEDGWRIATVWECALRKPDQMNVTTDLLSAWLRSNELQLQIGDDEASSVIRADVRSAPDT